ncbi:MAG: pilus assembly protein PilM [Deltaproteobacteria bacterium]|nr:pilus assembly protein PilM [Deltaproteobacteria bacterium]
MTILKKKKILGLAVEEGAILASELRSDGDSFKVAHAAEFLLPDGVTFEDSDKAGNLFGQFLRENGFSAKRAVIGIPAKWLILRKVDAPPSTEDELSQILKIQAEREFSLNLDDLMLDYIGKPDTKKPGTIFLVAALKKRIYQIIKSVESAGPGVLSVTVSSLALASVSLAKGVSQRALYLRPQYSEFLSSDGKIVFVQKFFQTPFPDVCKEKTEMDKFSTEIRRSISLQPDMIKSAGLSKLIVWNAAGLDETEFQTFQRAFSPDIEIVSGDLSLNGHKSAPLSKSGQQTFQASAALGFTALRPETLPMDLIHSKITVEKKSNRKKWFAWSAAIITALVLSGLVMFFDWKKDKEAVAELSARLADLNEEIIISEDIVSKVTAARGWHSKRISVLNCLREMTKAFPEKGSIWVTDLVFNENMLGIVSGRSEDEKIILAVLDKLKASDSFSDVQMLYMRESGRGSKEVSFSINFSFENEM